MVLGSFSHNFIKYTFDPFLSIFSFWDPAPCTPMQKSVCLLFQWLSYSHFKISFPLCCSDWVAYVILSSRSPMPSVAPKLLFISSSVFFIPLTVSSSSGWIFFILSSSLLKYSVNSFITDALSSLSGYLSLLP